MSRVLTERYDLPHEYAEAPHVGLGGEERVDERLGRHPPDGQGVASVSGLDDLAVLVGEPRHPEVGDLAELVVVHQDVSGRQVSMDYLEAGQ